MTNFAMSSRRQTYRVASPLKVLTPAILALAFTFVLIFAVTEPEDRAYLPYFGIVLIVILGIVAWLMTRTRLEVSSDGVTYYSIGYKVRSTWANINGYGKRLMGSQDVEVLILREPGMEMRRWMQIGYMLYPVGQVAAATQGRFLTHVNLDDYSVWIPIGLYADNWRDGELGQWVKVYAPQAFDNPM